MTPDFQRTGRVVCGYPFGGGLCINESNATLRILTETTAQRRLHPGGTPMTTLCSRGPSAIRPSLRAVFLVLALVAWAAAPGFALAPTVLAEIGRGAVAAIGAVPGGGYLLVWQDANVDIKMRRISAAAFPVGPTKTVLTLAEPVLISAVVVAESGAWAVFWTEGAGADQVGVGVAFFDAQDRFVRQVSYPDPIPDPGARVISFAPHAIALPGGGFAVAFTVGIQEDPVGDPLKPNDTDAWIRRVDAEGQQIGQPVRVNEETAGFQSSVGIGFAAGNVVVSWRTFHDEARDLRARLLGLNLTPASGEIHVNETPITGDADLAVGSDGRFVVVWEGQEGVTSSIRIRAFGPAGNPLSGERAADPSEPGRQGVPDIAITKAGVVWVSWVIDRGPSTGEERKSEIFVRPFNLDAAPLASAQSLGILTGVAAAPFLTGGESGALVAWAPASESPLLVGILVGQAAGPGTPPAELALESPQVPGFRVWVRITSRPAESLWGTRTEPCLAEALCAAGALPDRAEVIVRVVGPKPNGFLWPTIVKLSTSQAEVWLEQKASGAVQYYLLPGASLDSGILPGLFDRYGFEP